jgi:hypothetical protein
VDNEIRQAVNTFVMERGKTIAAINENHNPYKVSWCGDLSTEVARMVDERDFVIEGKENDLIPDRRSYRVRHSLTAMVKEAQRLIDAIDTIKKSDLPLREIYEYFLAVVENQGTHNRCLRGFRIL